MIIQILDHLTDEIKQIRIDVFMKEQGFEDEFDDIDEIAKFVLLFIDGKPAGTCRYFPSRDEGDAHIGRMAVRKLYRGQHLGTKIMITTYVISCFVIVSPPFGDEPNSRQLTLLGIV